MLRAITSTRRIGSPSGAPSTSSDISGAAAQAAPEKAVTATKIAAARALAALGGPEPLTRELRLSGVREALHQLLEGLARGRRLPLALPAQGELVERRRSLVAAGIERFHFGVLHLRAVEDRLGEEALPHSVLGVVRELGRGEP